jgi:hypothetical protein
VGENGIVLGDFEREPAEFVFGRFGFHFAGAWRHGGEAGLTGRDVEASSN